MRVTRTISACEARGLGDIHIIVIIGSSLGCHNAEELIYLNKIRRGERPRKALGCPPLACLEARKATAIGFARAAA